MTSITVCGACGGHTADSIIAGRRVCCFCGGDKGGVGAMEQQWCRFCKRMTAHVYPGGPGTTKGSYCEHCFGNVDDREPPRDWGEILVRVGLSPEQRRALVYLRWLFKKGEWDDALGH